MHYQFLAFTTDNKNPPLYFPVVIKLSFLVGKILEVIEHKFAVALTSGTHHFKPEQDAKCNLMSL